MSDRTAIEWCDSTFNPWIGCTKISPACDHCYAEAQMDTRMGRVEWGAGNPRSRTSAAYWRQPVRWNAQPFWKCDACGWRGDRLFLGQFCPPESEGGGGCGSASVKPARRRVFCASLADVFDNEDDPEWRADLFELIAATPNLDWLLLTKRIGNVLAMARATKEAIGARQIIGSEFMRREHRLINTAYTWTLSPNPLPPSVWLGATICNQTEADRDIPKLLAVPAAKRFLSIEPMLGPVDLMEWWLKAPTHCERCDSSGPGGGREFTTCPWGACPHDTGANRLDWIIVGGESGPRARPMHPDWVRSLRDQCAASGVPFLFKQWGGLRRSATEMATARCATFVGMQRVGKRAAGRQLDGREHSEWPA